MNDINFIDSCQAHLPVQYASNIEFIRQKWHWDCDWQLATDSCLLHCLAVRVRFSVLHANKTVNTIAYLIQNCFVS